MDREGWGYWANVSMQDHEDRISPTVWTRQLQLTIWICVIGKDVEEIYSMEKNYMMSSAWGIEGRDLKTMDINEMNYNSIMCSGATVHLFTAMLQRKE